MGFFNKKINKIIVCAISISLISLLALCFIPYKVYSENSQGFLNKEDVQFLEFCQTYSKSYFNTTEYEKRKLIFTQTLKFIEQTNESENGFELGVNFLSDMTEEER